MVHVFVQDEDETDSPAKTNAGRMSEHLITQLEDRVSCREREVDWEKMALHSMDFRPALTVFFLPISVLRLI